MVEDDNKDLKMSLEKYLKNAKVLFGNLKIRFIENKNIDISKVVSEFETMSRGYYNDAVYFYEKGKYVQALAALEYAEGWFDAGVALGIFEPKTKTKDEHGRP